MRIPTVQDTQVCWLLLLMCASTRANFWLRMIRPDQTLQYAERHDAAVWRCLCAILGSRSSRRRTGHSELPTLYGRPWAHVSGGRIASRHPTLTDVIMRGIDHHPALCFDAVRTWSMLWWKLDWRSHLGERCRSPRQLVRHTHNRTARSLVGRHRANMSLEEQRFASHWAALLQIVRALWRS